MIIYLLFFNKVILKTSLGEITVELWSKECPLACRNFVQLCMEGYYDGTIFHRVDKDFIAQGGDPTGTGHGGESIYGAPFKVHLFSLFRALFQFFNYVLIIEGRIPLEITV